MTERRIVNVARSRESAGGVTGIGEKGPEIVRLALPGGGTVYSGPCSREPERFPAINVRVETGEGR